MKILFTCAGRRNYLLSYFKDNLKGRGQILATDMQRSAPALSVADHAFIVPSVYDAGYTDAILTICEKEEVNAVISLNDLELPVLAEARPKFEQVGTKLLVSSDEVIDLCFDKWKTAQFAESIGIKVPLTYLSLDDAKAAIEKGDLQFPLVVKPRWGSASIGIEFPESVRELELAYELLKLRLGRTILAEASTGDSDHAILIQQKIKGKEFGLDVLNDLHGKPQQVYVKEKLAMRAGETDKAVLRDIPELENLGFTIGSGLKHICNLDCDVFEYNGEYYLLELNPRFGGGYPFSQMSGANYPGAILSWLRGLDADPSYFTKDFNSAFSKCDTLIQVEVD